MDRVKHRYQILLKCINCLFIILFIYAATSKLLTFENFKIQLEKSPFISNYAGWLAWCIPISEYLISGLFLFPKYIRPAYYGSLILMSLFTSYIFFVLNFSASKPCSCGGIIAKLGWKEHLVFNLIFIVLSFIGLWLIHKHPIDHLNKNTT